LIITLVSFFVSMILSYCYFVVLTKWNYYKKNIHWFLKTTFDIPEIISSLVIILNLYIISIFPLGGILKDYVYYIQIFLFILFLVLKLDVQRVLNFDFRGNNLILYCEVALGIIFIFITLVYSWNNNNDLQSASKIITYILFFIVYFNYYSYTLITNINLFNKFLDIIIAFTVVNSIFGWYSLLLGSTTNVLYGGFHLGFFNHPNTNACIYSLSVPIIFYKVVFADKRKYLDIVILVFLFVFKGHIYRRWDCYSINHIFQVPKICCSIYNCIYYTNCHSFGLFFTCQRWL